MPASLNDTTLFYAWRAMPDADAASLSSLGPYYQHRIWFSQEREAGRLRTIRYSFDKRTSKVGYVRMDAERWVSIYVEQWVRGRGISTHALRLFGKQMGAPLKAQIRSENERSVRAFTSAGFAEIAYSPSLVAEPPRPGLVMMLWGGHA